MEKRGSQFWRKLVRAYERSGLRQQVFCDQHGIKLGTFQYWLYKTRREATGPATALVRVEMPNQSAGDTPLQAGLPGGIVLRITPGTDPRYVAALLTEVGNARC